MAVKVRQRTLPSGDTHYQADIRVTLADGSSYRERTKAPGSTRAQALRWARKREAHILRHGPPRKEAQPNTEAQPIAEAQPIVQQPKPREVPTFAEFLPRFIEDHIEANRLSPTTKRDYENTIKNHFLPVLGNIRMDRLEARHVQALKRRKLATTTVNKNLKQLRSILRTAQRWGVIDKPLKFRGVKQPDKHPRFYDFGEYRLLTRAARRLSPETYAAVRLGGDAGLRLGEIIGLRWSNVRFDRRKLYICDNLVKARDEPGGWVIRQPKGGRPRWVPISGPLEKALKAIVRRGEHVITTNTGRIATPNVLRRRLATAQRHAGLKNCGPHILRHTFCSQLVLRGVHVRTIQKLAGHANLSTTEVYMHLISEVEEDAIRRLREDETDE